MGVGTVSRLSSAWEPQKGKGKKKLVSFELTQSPPSPSFSSSQVHTFRAAPSLSRIMPSGYDFIGWDPRGIGKTTPLMQCFETMKEETTYLNKRAPDPEVKAEKEVYYEAVRKVDRENKEMAERCEAVVGREGRFVSFVGGRRRMEGRGLID